MGPKWGNRDRRSLRIVGEGSGIPVREQRFREQHEGDQLFHRGGIWASEVVVAPSGKIPLLLEDDELAFCDRLIQYPLFGFRAAEE